MQGRGEAEQSGVVDREVFGMQNVRRLEHEDSDARAQECLVIRALVTLIRLLAVPVRAMNTCRLFSLESRTIGWL